MMPRIDKVATNQTALSEESLREGVSLMPECFTVELECGRLQMKNGPGRVARIVFKFKRMTFRRLNSF